MGVTWDALAPSTRKALSDCLALNSKLLTQQGLSNSMWSLQAMGFSIDDLQDCDMDAIRVRESFAEATIRLASEFSAQSLATTLYSMSRMSYNYPSLTPGTRTSLEAAFVREAGTMGAKEISTSLYGLGKMNAMFRNLPIRMQKALLSTVTDTCHNMDEQELGNSIWALGHIGHGIFGETGDALLNMVVKRRKVLRRQSLLAIMQALGSPSQIYDATYGATNPRGIWANFPATVRDALLDATMRLLDEPLDAIYSRDPRLAGTVLYWLGRMQAAFFDVPVDVRTRLISHVSVTASNSAFKEITVTANPSNLAVEQIGSRNAGHVMVLAVNGIACMGATWGRLDAKDRVSLQEMVTCCCKQSQDAGVLAPMEVASLLWSLGRMGLQIGSLTNSTERSGENRSVLLQKECDDSESKSKKTKLVARREVSTLEVELLLALEQNVHVMSGYEIAWCLWGIARIGLTFADLIKGKRALGSLLLLAINKHIGSMGEREVGIVLWVSLQQSSR
jgi:hypothetical protein